MLLSPDGGRLRLECIDFHMVHDESYCPLTGVGCDGHGLHGNNVDEHAIVP